jgi:RNA polymerase sigma-70 factor (ECF subfamily)
MTFTRCRGDPARTTRETAMSDGTTVRLQRCLDRLRAGDQAARNELLGAASERLERLARKMLRADGRLRRREQTEDVFQSAALRLCRALQSVTPASLREFFRLAALQVRRELTDLARHHYGPPGAARHASQLPEDDPGSEGGARAAAVDPADGPSALAIWSELHELAGELPEEEREAFDLVYYQGLSHAEAAALLGVSTKTIQRRWQRACLTLHGWMGGELPKLREPP